MEMDPTKHRFYQGALPSAGQCVIVQVTSVSPLGVYVRLREYGDVQAMIPTSELTRRRYRSIQQLAKVDELLCCCVLRVDTEKGYIDLSKTRVAIEDSDACFAKFAKAKAVHSILLRTCEKLGLSNDPDVEDFYTRTSWKLDSGRPSCYRTFKTFKTSLYEPSVLEQVDLDLHSLETLIDTIKSHLRESDVKVVAAVSVMCLGPDGVDGVKAALKAGTNSSCESKHINLRVRYKESPCYMITAECPAQLRGEAFQLVQTCMMEISAKILSFDGGLFKVLDKPVLRGKIFAGDEDIGEDLVDEMDDTEDEGDEREGKSNGEGLLLQTSDFRFECLTIDDGPVPGVDSGIGLDYSDVSA